MTKKKSNKKIDLLAKEYLLTRNLYTAMVTCGYNVQPSAVYRMEHSERFRRAVRRAVLETIAHVRYLAMIGQAKAHQIKAAEALAKEFKTKDPPRPSPKRAEKPKERQTNTNDNIDIGW